MTPHSVLSAVHSLSLNSYKTLQSKYSDDQLFTFIEPH